MFNYVKSGVIEETELKKNDLTFPGSLPKWSQLPTLGQV